MFLDSDTRREVLEEAAIMECGFSAAQVDAASDADLLVMIEDWIAAGDECGSC
jgi:hypothetical protein